MFLPDREHVVALHIHDHLPPAQTEHFALDLEDLAAIEGFDAETVAGEGDDSFFQDQRFGLLGYVVVEDAEGLGRGRELRHSGVIGVMRVWVCVVAVGVVHLTTGTEELNGLLGPWGSVGWWS